MSDEQREKLIDLCLEIFASSELDYEVTIAGNGTNSAEAENVAKGILDILGIDLYSPEFSLLIAARVKELKEMYGIDDGDDEE